jgi:hypothetical protein
LRRIVHYAHVAVNPKSASRTENLPQTFAMSTAADNSSLRKSQGTRLMAARRHFKLETQALGAKFLAKATGQTIKADTYAQHENGIRSMSRAVAIYAEGYSAAAVENTRSMGTLLAVLSQSASVIQDDASDQQFKQLAQAA